MGVLLVEIQQVSEVLLQNLGKCTHVAMTTYLHYLRGYHSSRSPIAPTGNHTFLEVTAAEYKISTYHLLTLAHIIYYINMCYIVCICYIITVCYIICVLYHVYIYIHIYICVYVISIVCNVYIYILCNVYIYNMCIYI